MAALSTANALDLNAARTSRTLPKTQPVVFFIPNGAGGEDIVGVDACLSEQHTLTNTLTDHPVEQGFNVTDHSRPEPRTLQLDCVVSNTPLGAATGENFAQNMWLRFVALWQSPQLIRISTTRGLYESMGVTSVSNPVDAKSAQALRFTVSLKQVRVVQNKFTQVVKSDVPKAHPVKKQGAATTTETDRRTLGRKLEDGLKGAFGK